MIRVQKNWQTGIFTQTFHESGKLARAKKVSFSFGCADQYRKFGVSCGRNHGLQQDLVRYIEMTDGRTFLLQSC
jgi:hypothetical protein